MAATDGMAIPGTPSIPQDKKLIVRWTSQQAVLNYAKALLAKKKQFTELYNKFDAIDIAYARYKVRAEQGTNTAGGIDPMPSDHMSANVFAQDDVVPPIVISQVDSHVAYLAEVFLTGSPLFPVASSPAKRHLAEQFEALIDDHAALGGYVRQLLLFLRDCGKYNFGAVEADWDAIDQFSVMQDVTTNKGQKIDKKQKKFTRLKKLNVRNVVADFSVPIGEISENGDYAGYVERITQIQLKRLLNKYGAENNLYNADKALASSGTLQGYLPNFIENPQVSHYLTAQSMRNSGVSWDTWFDPSKGAKRGPPISGTMYEKFVLYARIMPADFGIMVPGINTPQIWKFVIINNQFMVHAKRIISAYDVLPILFGSPLEDGMDYQTQSVAEGAIPFQEATNTLYNIRFAASRRAVSDRALYLPDMIKPSDINSPAAAPKIPVSISQLSSKGLADAYHQIPFDMRGTEAVIQDATVINSFAEKLLGINSPRQGGFQKGNKSVKEWDDTMGGSDGRMRLPALTLEYQFFSPLKSIIGLNIFQYGSDAIVISQTSGKELDVKIADLRDAVLSFKMADGYTPKSKIAGTDVLLAGMQFISQSPLLQQAYGAYLPGMFAHFMSLSGAKGFEQYDPRNQQQAGPPNTGLPANLLQAPGGAAVPPNVLPAGVVPPGATPALPSATSATAAIPPT